MTSCKDCICASCLKYEEGQCHYGDCYDDYRVAFQPWCMNNAGTRKSWSNWNRKDEQKHWCRGGVFYPAERCDKYIKYTGCSVQECLKAVVHKYQDGFIKCPIIENFGCDKCYQEFCERRAI